MLNLFDGLPDPGDVNAVEPQLRSDTYTGEIEAVEFSEQPKSTNGSVRFRVRIPGKHPAEEGDETLDDPVLFMSILNHGGNRTKDRVVRDLKKALVGAGVPEAEINKAGVDAWQLDTLRGWLEGTKVKVLVKWKPGTERFPEARSEIIKILAPA